MICIFLLFLLLLYIQIYYFCLSLIDLFISTGSKPTYRVWIRTGLTNRLEPVQTDLSGLDSNRFEKPTYPFWIRTGSDRLNYNLNLKNNILKISKLLTRSPLNPIY